MPSGEFWSGAPTPFCLCGEQGLQGRTLGPPLIRDNTLGLGLGGIGASHMLPVMRA